jgi:Flp pilus assembly protein TadG
MKKILHHVFSFFQLNNTRPPRKRGWRKSRAQSLVEFAISLPIIILLLTGMVEFGFMLNTYLSLQDAARSTARRYSTINPYNADNTTNPAYFQDAAQYLVELLAPSNDPEARQITMDPTRDNVLVSLIGVQVNETSGSIQSITRYADVSGAAYYKLFNATNPPTAYPDTRIEEFMTADGSEPVDAGLLIIELYYGYEGVLNLPWTRPFMSPENPAMLYVSVIMPSIYAKPLLEE